MNMVVDAAPKFEVTDAWNQALKMATSFRTGCILFAALELNIFQHIPDEGNSAEDIARKVNISSRSAQQLLNALVACQFLNSIDEKYYPKDPEHQKYLKEGIRSIKQDLLLFKQENQVWLDIADIISGKKEVPDSYSRELLDNRIINYQGICSSNTQFAIECLSKVFDLITACRKILDMGGGDGIYSSMLMQIHPQAQLTVLDLPEVFKGCHKHLSKYIDSGQVNLFPCDARELESTHAFDLVVMNELLEMFSKEEKLIILRKARSVSDKIIITKFSLDADSISPGGSAVFSFRMNMKYPGSYLAPDEEIKELLTLAGFTDVYIHTLPIGKSVIVAGFSENQRRLDSGLQKAGHISGPDKAMLKTWRAFANKVTGFRQSTLFFAALETGLFDAITPYGGSTIEELSEETGINPLSLRLMLNVFTATGLTGKDGDRYFFDDQLRPYLTEGKNSFKNELFIYKYENRSWLQMSDKLSGKIPKTVSFEEDMLKQSSTEAYIRSVEIANKSFIKYYVEIIFPYLKQAEHILDPGGGHGSHAKHICDQFDHVTVDIVDFPSVLKITEKLNGELIKQKRLNLISGNVLNLSIDKLYDMATVNDLLHYFSEEEKVLLLKNIYSVLNKNGIIVISDFYVEDQKYPANHIFSLKAHLKTNNGQLNTLKKLIHLTEEAGFVPIEVYPGAGKAVLICEKE